MFQPCDCDPHGSFDNNCDPLTGQCACKLDYNGTQCDSCLFGFYGFPDCQLCLCSVEGTNPKSCDSDGACRCANADGQCNCKVSRSNYSLLPHSPHLINPFRTNGIFHKATYKKVRMVHCMFSGVTGYNFPKILYFFF